MVSILRATEKDYQTIVSIGNISVEEAHRESCSAEDMRTYLNNHYNDDAIKLSNPENIYHIICYKNEPVGFSKIVLNAEHPNIPHKNATKLDRLPASAITTTLNSVWNCCNTISVFAKTIINVVYGYLPRFRM